MMTTDIEECLAAVVKALKKSNLPPADVIAWCAAMLKADRVGFIPYILASRAVAS
jgi:hypothetical protein